MSLSALLRGGSSVRLIAGQAKLNSNLAFRKSGQVSNNDNSPKGPVTTSFGFKEVLIEEKEVLVRNVFDSVASKYDLMNDATSFGIHRLWKDAFVEGLRPGRAGPQRCIDVAGGTGDIALRILEFAREKYGDRETSVDVVDINTQMLKEGYRRFKQTMYHNSKCPFMYSPIALLTALKLRKYHLLRETPRNSPGRSFMTTHMTSTLSRLASAIAPLLLLF